MEPKRSLPYLQQPFICSYPDPDQSNPNHFLSHLSKIHLILSSHLRLGLSSGLLLSNFPTKIILYAHLPASSYNFPYQI